MKKFFKISNIIMFSLMAGIIVFSFILHLIENNNVEKFGVSEGGISYISTNNGYHFFYKSAFLDGGLNIAIPDTEKIPQFTKIYKPVKFYRHTSDNYDGYIEINGESYNLANEVNKIAPDYFDLIVSTAACDIILIFVVNLSGCVVTLIIKRKKKHAYNN